MQVDLELLQAIKTHLATNHLRNGPLLSVRLYSYECMQEVA